MTHTPERHVILAASCWRSPKGLRKRATCTCGWYGRWRSATTLTWKRDGVAHIHAHKED